MRDGAVLVVGGAGYIGSHTVLALKAAGYRTVVYDDFSTGHRDAVFGDLLVEGSLADAARLAATMRDCRITAVIHFAALIEAGESVRDPLRFWRHNVAHSVALIEAMRAAGVGRIVFSSTAAVYGNQDRDAPLDESLPMRPENPYGATKAAVEAMLGDLAAAGQLQAVALRYFNAAGADPEGRTGERHEPETHLVPLVLDAALGRRPSIAIYGTDYPTPDGTCIRDYIHVCDLARGHVAALERLQALPAAEGFYRPVNLGTGQGHSVREVIEAARRITGRQIAVVEAGRRPGDPARLVADVRRAGGELGWTARDSALDRIIEDAWRFHRRRHGG